MASPPPRSRPANPGSGGASQGARPRPALPPVETPPASPANFGVHVDEPPSPLEAWWNKVRSKGRALWTSKKAGAGILKDLVIAAVVVGVLLALVWGYTGQPAGQAPLVVVESGSMMHVEHGYGRVGTIDPGDLVFVKDVDKRSDIRTYYQGLESHYGNPGDVIVYKPGGGKETPIIHRAMTWIRVTCVPSGLEAVESCPVGDSRRYTYDAGDRRISDSESVSLPEIGITGWHPQHSGFITKGDNNPTADQPGSISPTTVKMAWVIGVARGELPWFGLIKLALYGNEAQPAEDWCTVLEATAPCDTWVMLGVSLGVLVAIPLVIDFVQYLRTRRDLKE